MKNKASGSAITTCLAITDKAIKFVQVKSGNISCLQAIGLASKTDEELLRGIQPLLKAKQQKSLGRFILVVSRSLAAMHYVKLPSTKPDEIRDMARIQATKQLPYEPQAIVLGYQLIRTTAEGYSEVLLIIVHQDIIKKYLEILAKYKLEPQEIILDSQGMPYWLKLQKDAGLEKGSLVVDLDASHIRLDIVALGMSIYSRAFSFNFAAAEYKIKLIEEINKSLLSYEKENVGIRPKGIVFTGAQELLGYIDDEVIKGFSLSAIKLPQNRFITLRPSSSVRAGDLQRNSFTSIFGIALSPGKPSYNLIPQNIIAKREQAGYKTQFSKTVLIGCLVVGTLAAVMVVHIAAKKKIIRDYKEELSSLSADVDQIEKMAKKLNYVKNERDESTICLDALAEVFRIASLDISLAYFGYSAQKPLVLKGQAKALSDVFNFVNTLEASEIFKEVEVRHSSKRRIKDQEVADFEITCQIERK